MSQTGVNFPFAASVEMKGRSYESIVKDVERIVYRYSARKGQAQQQPGDYTIMNKFNGLEGVLLSLLPEPVGHQKERTPVARPLPQGSSRQWVCYFDVEHMAELEFIDSFWREKTRSFLPSCASPTSPTPKSKLSKSFSGAISELAVPERNHRHRRRSSTPALTPRITESILPSLVKHKQRMDNVPSPTTAPNVSFPSVSASVCHSTQDASRPLTDPLSVNPIPPLIQDDTVLFPSSLSYNTAFKLYVYYLVEKQRYCDALKTIEIWLHRNPTSTFAYLERLEILKSISCNTEYRDAHSFSRIDLLDIMFRETLNVMSFCRAPKDLAKCYRNAAYYFIEGEQFDAAIATCLKSVEYDQNLAVVQILRYICKKRMEMNESRDTAKQDQGQPRLRPSFFNSLQLPSHVEALLSHIRDYNLFKERERVQVPYSSGRLQRSFSQPATKSGDGSPSVRGDEETNRFPKLKSLSFSHSKLQARRRRVSTDCEMLDLIVSLISDLLLSPWIGEMLAKFKIPQHFHPLWASSFEKAAMRYERAKEFENAAACFKSIVDLRLCSEPLRLQAYLQRAVIH